MENLIPEFELCRLGWDLVERTGDGLGTFPEVSEEVVTGWRHRDCSSGRPSNPARFDPRGLELDIETLPLVGRPRGVDARREDLVQGAAIGVAGRQAETLQNLYLISSLQIHSAVSAQLWILIELFGDEKLDVQAADVSELRSRRKVALRVLWPV